MLSPCCKKDSFVWYKSKSKSSNNVDVTCTTDNHDKPTLFKCKSCKLIFSEYYNSCFENSYTDVVDEKYIKQIPIKKINFELFFSKIKSYLSKDHDVLEIGSYYGILGSIIKSQVKSYIGLELSRHAANHARKNYNLNIVNETINKFFDRAPLFDIIIMNDVIEHLDDPFKTLELIGKHLKPNGILIFTTCDMDAIVPKIMGGRYHWIMPMHKFYFSNTNLRYFLKINNMDLFKIKYDTKLTNIEYFFSKLSILFPNFKFIFQFFLKFNFLKKIKIKINLLDLNIYFAKKSKSLK